MTSMSHHPARRVSGCRCRAFALALLAAGCAAAASLSACATGPKEGEGQRPGEARAAKPQGKDTAAAPAAGEAKMREWTELERETVEMSFIALAGCWQAEPEATAATVTNLMARMLPAEEIVWGPAIHLPDPAKTAGIVKLSDALLFVCRDRGSGEYFVVFRGTNTISAAEWVLQDFMVQKQVPWLEVQPGPAPAEALVSEGTATALDMRRGLRPAAGLAGEGKSLAEALVSILEASPGPCAIHFTGHSLGGLLAPTMALWFLDYLEAEGRQDLSARLRLDVYAYAGPSAGNKAYADYLAARVPGLRRYANPLDIAPRAWEPASMAELPGLYLPAIKMQPVTSSLYRLCLGITKDKGYAQPGAAIPVPARVVPAKAGLFLLEASYQHAVPYLDILQPERKAMIIDEVIRPIARSVAVKGLKPIELEELFR
jgi:hypothetical protein